MILIKKIHQNAVFTPTLSTAGFIQCKGMGITPNLPQLVRHRSKGSLLWGNGLYQQCGIVWRIYFQLQMISDFKSNLRFKYELIFPIWFLINKNC